MKIYTLRSEKDVYSKNVAKIHGLSCITSTNNPNFPFEVSIDGHEKGSDGKFKFTIINSQPGNKLIFEKLDLSFLD